MTKVYFSSTFQKAYKKRVKRSITADRFKEKLDLFINDPYTPSLKTHKLSGHLKGFYAFSIEYDLRIVFKFIDKNEAVFTDIGKHDVVY